jgi:hypothetical protein
LDVGRTFFEFDTLERDDQNVSVSTFKPDVGVGFFFGRND